MSDVIALVDDLFFQAKMAETARQTGVQVLFVTSGEAFLAEAAANPAALLIVDLNSRLGSLETIETLNASGASRRVIAFLSHVQVELAERAKAAGCTQVLPRSKFTQKLAEILTTARK